jgi:hypothetical protein
MTHFLRGLVKDLQNKVQILLTLLNSTKIHEDLAADYAWLIQGRLERLQTTLTDMAADDDLLNPILLVNNLKKYRTLSREVQLLEAFPIPVILRYTESDHYFFKLSRCICKQIGYPLVPPVVSASSADYYWAYPQYRLIAVPVGEEFLLLNLPDFYHELAHYLYAAYTSYLVGEFMNDLDRYFEIETERTRDEQQANPDWELFEAINFEWKEKWIIEFICDMIATYLTGPTYGWANLRLCANSLARFEIFGPTLKEFPAVEHPSDEARMRGIYAMLRKFKQDNEIKNIDEKWQQYMTLSSNERPQGYIYFYPDDLLADLAQYVFDGCKNIGLIPFTEQQLSTEMNLTAMLNAAWNKFRQEPDQYPDWERTQLKELRTKLEAS